MCENSFNFPIFLNSGIVCEMLMLRVNFKSLNLFFKASGKLPKTPGKTPVSPLTLTRRPFCGMMQWPIRKIVLQGKLLHLTWLIFALDKKREKPE